MVVHSAVTSVGTSQIGVGVGVVVGNIPVQSASTFDGG